MASDELPCAVARSGVNGDQDGDMEDRGRLEAIKTEVEMTSEKRAR